MRLLWKILLIQFPLSLILAAGINSSLIHLHLYMIQLIFAVFSEAFSILALTGMAWWGFGRLRGETSGQGGNSVSAAKDPKVECRRVEQ